MSFWIGDKAAALVGDGGGDVDELDAGAEPERLLAVASGGLRRGLVVVVSEENGQISLVERSRIVRNLNEAHLARSIRHLLDPNHGRRRGAFGFRPPRETTTPSAARAPR